MINLKEKGVILQLAPVKDFPRQHTVVNLLPASTLSTDVLRGRAEAQRRWKGQAAPEILGGQRKCGFRLLPKSSALCRAAGAVCAPLLISSPPRLLHVPLLM